VVQTSQAAWQGNDPALSLANAVPFMQAFGHTVVAWIWLDVVSALGSDNTPMAQGRRAACRYFYRYELPQIQAWLAVVRSRDQTCADLAEDAF
jgi:butyryl-CoA dehydrogenase